MTITARCRLEALRQADILEPLDIQFALATSRLAGELDNIPVVLGAAMACRAPRLGHIYADLMDPGTIRVEPTTDDEAVDPAELNALCPEGDVWVDALRKSALVIGEGPRPLVLEGSRLYLSRYWEYQEQLATSLVERASDSRRVDLTNCRDTLNRLFPTESTATEITGPDLQKLAVAMAALRGLTVITGGPGTGKTTTVVRLLALLVDLELRKGKVPPRIALAAPTGKAAARMAESIRSGKNALPLPPDVVDPIEIEASTLHRLLGFQRFRHTQFRHHAGNPLPVDILVVDEASMIPLSLMAKLVDAVPKKARLILLGDRDQLASVEAGAVLDDLCPPKGGEAPRFSESLTRELKKLGLKTASSRGGLSNASGIGDCVVHLEHSFRFDHHGGIGQLATAVNAGEGEKALELLRQTARQAKGTAELELIEGQHPQKLRNQLRQLVVDKLHPITSGNQEQKALAHIGRFCVLCAHRKGPFGSLSLNQDIQQWLATAGRLSLDREWYAGRPVMITQNDYRVGLFNGDIGVVLPSREDSRDHRVVFSMAEEPGFRSLSPSLLPPHETVFAMTVHKSQGSEFDEVVVVLPAQRSPILTRELLYTGITRARRRIVVVGSASVILEGIEERVQRASGLREKLWSRTL